MTNNKLIQITFRTTIEEKEIISKNAKKRGLSINEFIKNKVMSEDIKETSEEISHDITAKEELEQLRKDILEHYIAKSAYEDSQKQLEQKDIQIDQLHKIIYNKDTRLLEYDSKKSWWQFWK